MIKSVSVEPSQNHAKFQAVPTVNSSDPALQSFGLRFRRCDRQFKTPLKTRHGVWRVREAVIIRLQDATGRVGFGEIAPLDWFGSETLPQALDFCDRQPEITLEQILAIPNHLPACQFGFESAWQMLVDPAWRITPLAQISDSPLNPPILGDFKNIQSPPELGGWGAKDYLRRKSNHFTAPMSVLLPTGPAALTAWQTLYQQGDRTFKWKIGVDPPETEIKLYQRLVAELPAGVKLRLDANGGLDWRSANLWLEVCDPAVVEFLEQPLPVPEFTAMLALSRQFPTPIALDESVATIDQLAACHQRGWRGVFVLKPAIAGSPRRLRQFCQQHKLDLVFSSVFEGAIGRQAALILAAELGNPDRALGFGVNHWLESDSIPQPPTIDDFEALWHRL
jgi:o-succinylbenzoate synthase